MLKQVVIIHTKVSEEEAEQLYKEGKNVVVSAENNNIDIGFTNIKQGC